MFRLLARSALLLAVVTAAGLALIRLRGYDDSAVSQFFDSCTPMPCWQGIRPGETTTDAAIAILQAHPWVDTVRRAFGEPYPGAPTTTLVYWTWSSRYPFAEAYPFTRQGMLVTDQGIVQRISLTTGILLGDIWLALGSPDGGAVDYASYTSHSVLIENTALFSHAGVAATANLSTDCAFRYPNLWDTAVHLWLQDGSTLGVEHVAYPMYLKVMRTGYHRIRASFC